MRRREFITLVGGAAAWPLAAGAQQEKGTRRIGVSPISPNMIPSGGAWQHSRRHYRNWAGRMAATFRSTTEGPGRCRAHASIRGRACHTRAGRNPRGWRGYHCGFAAGNSHRPCRFRVASRPGRRSVVESLSRPGGNTTGFTPYEYGISGKWLELLKEIAPRVTQAGCFVTPPQLRTCSVCRNPGCRALARRRSEPHRGARCRRVRTFHIGLRTLPDEGPDRDRECAHGRASRSDRHARGPSQASCGLFPALLRYCRRPDLLWRRLRRPVPPRGRLRGPHPEGRKPAHLPVQASTKYELVINLKTAKALGLDTGDAARARRRVIE